MKIILTDFPPDDLILGVRAAQYLMAHFKKDAILSYGERPNTKDVYVRRNKSSITARLCTFTQAEHS
jgi:hypothetical protein